MAELPVELITEILQLLPVKTLLRFRCVSKSIRDTIDSRDFIKSHLNATSDYRSHKKLILRRSLQFSGDNQDHISSFFVFDIDGDFQRVFDCSVSKLQCEYFAHCNGLILLGEELYSLSVWNPSIMKFKKLPLLPENASTHNRQHTGLGFGYDSCSDDYKVLLITELVEDDNGLGFEIWILGLRRSCYWRKIEDNIFPYDEYKVFSDNINCFVDGAFHFLCEGDIVCAFDVAKETVSRVSLPHFGKTIKFPANLQVFEGCLCLSFFWEADDGKEQMELYVRKKDGVEFCWIKLFSSANQSLFHRIGIFLAYTKEGDEILLLDAPHSLVYLYDVKERSLHSVVTEDFFDLKIIFCIESLVSVD